MPAIFKDSAFWNVIVFLITLAACVYGLYTKELTLATAATFFGVTMGLLRTAVAIETHATSTETAAKIRAGADKAGP